MSSDRIRILVLNANQKLVGTYGRCFFFSRELARAGHDVTMVTVSRDSKYRPRVYFKRDFLGEADRPGTDGPWFRMIEAPNLGYRWLPGWGSGPIDIFGRVREIIGGKYDVVYGFEYQPNVSWPVYLTSGVRDFRFYSDWADWYAGNSNSFRGYSWAHKIDTFLEERVRYRAAKVTVISRVLEERAKSIGIEADRIEQVKQGIDTDYYACLPMASTRDRMRIPLDLPVLATTVDGDITWSVRIFRHVLRQVPNALFIIVGKPQQTAISLARELGIEKSIYFAGWVADEDYPRYLACADILFLPLADSLNNRARFPGKVLDFLCAGRPVVTHDVGEVGDLFKEERLGALAPQNDEQFGDLIVSLLRDSELRLYLGGLSRCAMVERWDWRLRGPQIARVVQN